MKKTVTKKVYKKTGIVDSPKIREYTIYHRTNLKESLGTEKQPRKFIRQIKAKDMTEAYQIAQVYTTGYGRPTGPGDLIQDHYGYYLINEDDSFKLLCLNDDEGGE